MSNADQRDYRVPFSGVGYRYSEGDRAVVARAMDTSSTLTQGVFQKQFEADFAQYLGVSNAFATSSAAAALELAAILCGVTEGDEVIVPAHTYCATAYPFARHGAKMRWADIDRDTFVMSAENVRSLMTNRTKAIIAVHLYGLPVDLGSLRAIADEFGVLLVEDCAQSIGATYHGQQAGSFGDLAVFSFQSHKNISTLGEGGMLTVRDEGLARLVPGLRHNGHRPFQRNDHRYWHPAMSDVGFDLPNVWPHNFCLGEPQAALGSELLPRVEALNGKRRSRFRQAVVAFGDLPEIALQSIPEGRVSSHHLLPFRYDGEAYGANNHDFMEKLVSDFSIQPATQYFPLYRYELFSSSGNGAADVPNTDEFFDNMVSLPFHVWMSDDDFSYLLDSVSAVAQALRQSGGRWAKMDSR